MRKIEVFIGAETAQAISYRVLKTSIRIHSPAVIVHNLGNLVKFDSTGRTPFSEQRFFIPSLANEDTDFAIYLDSDMLVFSKIED